MRHLLVQAANSLIIVATVATEEEEAGSSDRSKAEATETAVEIEIVALTETRSSEINPNGTHRAAAADLAASGEIIGETTIMEIKVCVNDCEDWKDFNRKYLVTGGGWGNNQWNQSQQYGNSNSDGSGDANQQWMAYYQVSRAA